MKKKITIRQTVISIIGILLLGVWIYQMAGAVRYLGDRFQNKVLANRDLDAIERSADASYGSEYAAFISFLRSSIPDLATVLIPSGQGSTVPFNNIYLMQYLLFPRRIVNCPTDCSAIITAPDTYVIAQNDFPPRESIPSSIQYISYNDTLGLYIPVK